MVTGSSSRSCDTTNISDSYAAALAVFKPAVTTSGGGGTGGGSATTTRYFHEDHLNSTNVVTDYRGNVVQTLDYYPYGSQRINTSTGSNNEAKSFIGQVQDPEDNLNYLNARYYNSKNGQFLSEDPQFWADPARQNLRNPQTFNSYSYASNNPIIASDPTGQFTLIEAYLSLLVLTVAVLAYATLSSPAVQHSMSTALDHATPTYISAPYPGATSQLPTSLPSPTIVPTQSGIQPYNFAQNSDSNNGQGQPKSPQQFLQPTNSPQMPPDPKDLPEGTQVRIGPKTKEYPDGYWRMIDQNGHPIDPTDMKYPDNASSQEVRQRTHIPLPPGTDLPAGPYNP